MGFLINQSATFRNPSFPISSEITTTFICEKYNLKIGKKRYIVCGGVLIGILTGLGVAIGITKNQKQIKRMKEEYNVLNFDYKNNYCILSLDK